MARTPPPTPDIETRPRAVGADGWLLDEHGLPVNGPARLAALDGRPDPALAADAPQPPPAADPTPSSKEQSS